MISDEIKQKLKQEKNVEFVCDIIYNKKKYIKTIKILKSGIEYIYYEIDNNQIKEISNEDVFQYLRKHYEIKEGSICY